MPTVMQKFWLIVNDIAKKISRIFDIELDGILKIFMNNEDVTKIFNPDYFKLTTET